MCHRESQLRNTPRKNELYVGLSGREEKSQKWIHSQGPSGFVVLSALDFAVAQVVAFLPAATDQRIAKLAHIVNFVHAFLGAGVEPDARPWFDAATRDVIHNPALVPP